MRKFRVGLLTFSDGREYLHRAHLETNLRYQNRVKAEIEATGEADVVDGHAVIWDSATARQEAEHMQQAGVDLVIFNYAIWCYPHLSAIAATLLRKPIILFSNLHPSEPGMVAMLAAAGTMDQLGYRHSRIWGDIGEKDTREKVMAYIRAAAAVSMLRGMTFGTFGGRPLGMYTAVANLDQWQRDFGIDIECNEQEDIVRYADAVDQTSVQEAQKWLEDNVGSIQYDGKALTPQKLQLAIRAYIALRRLIRERHLDFIGIKAHGDLTDHFVTMDLAEAFLNDPYDWEGPHEPIIASTESDMDGGLTMQVLKHITRAQPVLFADVRHYDAVDEVWYFSNSGTHPTFFAGRSMDARENLRKVTFYPEVSDYPAGGPSVHHFAAPGRVTLARLARKEGRYWLAIVPGYIVEFNRENALARGRTVTPQWPIAFTKLGCSADEFLSSFPCNHIHGVYGDFTRELIAAGKVMGIETRLFGAGHNPSPHGNERGVSNEQ
ncbi:MAG: L-fucose/L-arabinose isomerase family protein [Spirochaetia bacterium]|jgi:L-fucose isomerase